MADRQLNISESTLRVALAGAKSLRAGMDAQIQDMEAQLERSNYGWNELAISGAKKLREELEEQIADMEAQVNAPLHGRRPWARANEPNPDNKPGPNTPPGLQVGPCSVLRSDVKLSSTGTPMYYKVWANDPEQLYQHHPDGSIRLKVDGSPWMKQKWSQARRDEQAKRMAKIIPDLVRKRAAAYKAKQAKQKGARG